MHTMAEQGRGVEMSIVRSCLIGIAVCAATAWCQVTLSTGVTVPKDHFIVYICMGNSEMEGQTTVSGGSVNRPTWDSTSPRLWNFNVQDGNNPGPNHTWIPARGKNHAGSLAAYPNWLGPDMPLLKELAKQYSSDYYFGILKVANQGDRLRGQYLLNQAGWDPNLEWTQIVDAIAAIGPATVTWGGAFTVFCDMEVHDALMGYAGAVARLDSLSYDVITLTQRLRVQTGSDLPLLFACPPAGYFSCIDGGHREFWDKLNVQLSIIPTLDSRAAVIPMWWGDTSYVLATYVDASTGHYSEAGLLKLAEQAVSIIKTNNWIAPLGVDTAPPSVPTNLAASNIGSTSVTLTWSPSTDDKGVSNYTVYRGSDSVATVATATATITGLTASTAYTFAVKARDFSGKVSALSTPLQVTTAAQGADTQAPTVPSGLHAVSVGLTSVAIAWSASTDNFGVTGYVVYQDGAAIDTVTDLQDTISGLTQQTAYSYTVAAGDAARNLSAQCSALQVTTGNPVTFPIKINVGGPAMLGYLADQQWTGAGYGYTGTATTVATGSGDVTGTTEDSVYYTERYGADLGYRIVAPDGRYDVTFMFAEYWHVAGDRVFTPFINGVAATAQAIDVAAAVGQHAAYTVTFRVKITAGLIDITFTHQGGNSSAEVPILNGLVVANAPAYTILGPEDGDTSNVGDTLHIRWAANENLVTGADIFISPDDGLTWLLVNAAGTVVSSNPYWENYPFVVPRLIQGQTITGTPLMLKLEGYNGGNVTPMTGHLFVRPSSSAALDRKAGHAVNFGVRKLSSTTLAVEGLPTGESACIVMYRPDGSVACRRTVSGESAAVVDLGRFGAGMYMVTVTAKTRNLAQKVSVLR
jgi:chitodextrinase